MLYKNISCSVKTFYGVTFKPGEVKEVPGYINDTKMVVVDASELKRAIKQPNTPSEKPKKMTSEKSSVTPEVKSEEKLPEKNDDNKSSSSKE